MLKAVSLEVSKPLAIIMNRSLSEGKFPENWKRSLVMPLYKKGDKTYPVNYRPISLLSNIGKSMETVMFKHLHNHLNGNNLIYKYQAGFLLGHSTTNGFSIYIFIFARHSKTSNMHVCFFVTYQRRLIECGIVVYFLN